MSVLLRGCQILQSPGFCCRALHCHSILAELCHKDIYHQAVWVILGASFCLNEAQSHDPSETTLSAFSGSKFQPPLKPLRVSNPLNSLSAYHSPHKTTSASGSCEGGKSERRMGVPWPSFVLFSCLPALQ